MFPTILLILITTLVISVSYSFLDSLLFDRRISLYLDNQKRIKRIVQEMKSGYDKEVLEKEGIQVYSSDVTRLKDPLLESLLHEVLVHKSPYVLYSNCFGGNIAIKESFDTSDLQIQDGTFRVHNLDLNEVNWDDPYKTHKQVSRFLTEIENSLNLKE